MLLILEFGTIARRPYFVSLVSSALNELPEMPGVQSCLMPFLLLRLKSPFTLLVRLAGSAAASLEGQADGSKPPTESIRFPADGTRTGLLGSAAGAVSCREESM